MRRAPAMPALMAPSTVDPMSPGTRLSTFSMRRGMSADATANDDRAANDASDAKLDTGAAGDAGSTDAVSADATAGDSGGPTDTGVWLKGDLHVHSKHSTDAMDTTVAEVIAKAESLGFDYFVLTDHDNHVEGKISTWSDPDYHSSKMVLLYGAEWTTGKGHANIFGTQPYDYAPIWAARDGDGAASIAIAHAQGLHFSVNHPAAKDLWEWGFELEYDSMEVWTAPFVLPNSNTNCHRQVGRDPPSGAAFGGARRERFAPPTRFGVDPLQYRQPHDVDPRDRQNGRRGARGAVGGTRFRQLRRHRRAHRLHRRHRRRRHFRDDRRRQRSTPGWQSD